MPKQDDNLTILISPAEGGGYTATAPGLNEAIEGETMAEALAAAARAIGSLPHNGLLVKVRKGTWMTARELVLLLGTTVSRRRDFSRHHLRCTWLDLSSCYLVEADLSPNGLDELGVADELRPPDKRGIDLSGAQLKYARLDRAQLQECRLDGAQLQRATLRAAQLQNASLDRAELQHADLSHVELRNASLDQAQLQNARMWGGLLQGANLLYARLREAGLEYAQFQDAHLVATQFQGANLSGAQLQGAELWRAEFQGTELRGADLRGVDFRKAANLDHARWHDARLEKTRLYRRQIEPIQDEMLAKAGAPASDYVQATEVYLDLKTNFSSWGNYEDAAWAYIKEQQMEKASYFPTTAGKHWLVSMLAQEPPTHWWTCSPGAVLYRLRSAGLHSWLLVFGTSRLVRAVRGRLAIAYFPSLERMDRPRWLRNWAYELLTGYGERPQMPVFWGLVTILVFALVFSVMGDVSPDFAGDPATAQGSHNFWDALTHSIGSFATIGFNTLEPIGRVARLLTAIESALGISFFALFIYTLGNRMSRS